MRHRVKGKKLNRQHNHRRALYRNLIIALIQHGQVKTTLAKAKAIQPEFDRLMSKAKDGSVHARRQIDTVLNQTKHVNTLVDVLAPLTKRDSGFTRIVRTGFRRGDNAALARLELVDQPKPEEPKPKTKPAADSKAKKDEK